MPFSFVLKTTLALQAGKEEGRGTAGKEWATSDSLNWTEGAGGTDKVEKYLECRAWRWGVYKESVYLEYIQIVPITPICVAFRGRLVHSLVFSFCLWWGSNLRLADIVVNVCSWFVCDVLVECVGNWENQRCTAVGVVGVQPEVWPKWEGRGDANKYWVPIMSQVFPQAFHFEYSTKAVSLISILQIRRNRVLRNYGTCQISPQN